MGNAVVAFERDADGRLTHEETIATGGLGSSAGLGDQGALEITADKHHLLVVNAGSDDVSLFKIEGDGLELVDVQGVGDRISPRCGPRGGRIDPSAPPPPTITGVTDPSRRG